MRGEDRGCRALFQRDCERPVLRDQIQRVGVEHKRHRRSERGAEQLPPRVGLAHARPGNENVDEPLLEQLFGLAQHQLGLRVVHIRRPRREQAQINASGAAFQRGAAGDDRGADHSRRSAQDAHAAGLPFVEVPGPRPDRAGENRFVEQLSFRFEQPGGIEPERIELQFAAMIRAIEREQAGLVGDERDGMARAHRAAHDRAGIGVDPARDVERENGNAERVEALDQRRVRSGKRPLEPDPEQAVDREIEARVLRNVIEVRPARGFPFSEARPSRACRARLRRQGSRERMRA